MAVTVTHPFVSPVVDEGDPNEVGPNEWNAAHTITGLGTAAEADSTDFASAAQGAKADTAVQSVVAGAGISVDATDPNNPIVSATGSGTGDMLAATYDPQNIADDAFDRANHTGSQLAATISDFSTAADARISAAVGVSVQAWDAQLDSLSTASANGVSLVQAANYAAMKALLDLEIGVDVQAYDADLTTWAGLTPSANAQSLVTAANYAAMRALLDLEAGTDFYSIAAADAAFQPKDADLTSWAGVTRASGFDTFAATPSSANLKTLVTDETGSGALMFGTSPSITTDITIPNTGLHLLDTDASHDLVIVPGSNLTADRNLTLTTGDAARTVTISGNATISQDYSTTGNPQFATIELGAASDTTLSRSGAGDIAVEGNAIYRAGGTDVPVADGGTGLSTLTANNVIIGNGTSAPTFVAPGTSGNVLTSNGTTWTSAAAAGGSSMTLLGTLTTSSGTTQSLTGIAAGYRQLYCEVEGVSFTANVAMTLALSSTNGAAYGTAQTISIVLSGGAAGSTAITGAIAIFNVSSAVAAAKSAFSVTALAAGATTNIGVVVATNTAAVVDAIQFAGGTFDAGTIRIYGVK